MLPGKGILGCWECPDFPCDNPMLNKPRVRTFATFIRDYGEAALMDLLEKNEAAGLRYHYEGSSSEITTSRRRRRQSCGCF
jgi:hypothetical protein